jgi:hypothetical protein
VQGHVRTYVLLPCGQNQRNFGQKGVRLGRLIYYWLLCLKKYFRD